MEATCAGGAGSMRRDIRIAFCSAAIASDPPLLADDEHAAPEIFIEFLGEKFCSIQAAISQKADQQFTFSCI